MRRIAPREIVIDKLEDVIGMDFDTNISPTMKAKFLGYEGDKAYYEVLEHEEHTKYNSSAGQIFYLPTQMAVTMQPIIK